ncbi:conserved hypothetical protein [Syntrophobacter sp. SbD2]|nr:conserved hypothetical protein [Syntrophobacter sp. SbD2]
MPADIVELRERRLGKLKPAQLARELMKLPAKRRLKLIVERPDAQSVVAALDANDFFHTVQEIGADDSLPLLALASFEQMNHLFDIEWWRKDTVEPAKALTWIERLWRAGGSKLLEWLMKADFELLVSLFKRWIVADIAPEDIDMVEAVETLPPKTIDGLYFWESRYPQYDDLITHLLTTIFETNYGFFKELMDSVRNASAPELEESAYHFHRARLEDHAIPDFYDALEIYRSIGADEFALKTVPRKADQDQPIPSFALALLSQGDLFARVVSRIEDPGLLEILQVEMASLANKVMVADQLPADNAEALRRAAEKALAYVNLGLESRSGANIEKAAQILRDNFLEHLFRLAQAEVAKIRGRLQSIAQSGWLSQCPAGIKCLDAEWFDAAEELLARTPRILKSRPGGSESGVLPAYDFFRTPQDLARGSHIVDVITCAGDLYELVSDHTGMPGQRLWTEGQVRTPEDITLGVMVLTAAANSLISGKWSAAPLSHVAWPKVFPLLQPPVIDRAVMDWVHRSLPDRERKSLAQVYLTPILRDYDFEMRPFSGQNPPKTQLVKFFMFSG